MKFLRSGCLAATLLCLAACDQPAATRPAPALASARDVSDAAAALPIAAPGDLERARLNLLRAADPPARAVPTSPVASSSVVGSASRAAAALLPYLPPDAASRVTSVAPALAASTVPPSEH